jgi:exonuclease III
MKMKHDRGYIIVIGAYAPEEGKKEETISFYKMIQKLLDKYNKSYSVLLIGDMNTRVGNQPLPGVVRTFGEETMNENGEKL